MAIQLTPSNVTCSNTTVGTAATITINKSNPVFMHTLEYTFKSFSGTIVEKTMDYTYTDWIIPIDFYGEMVNSTSGVATIHCYTYHGNNLIGVTHCDFTIRANPYDTPTINPTITDSNDLTIALTGNSKKLIRYRSTAHVAINAAARNRAEIASQKASNGSNYFTTQEGAFANVENALFRFEAIDSRGLKTAVGRELDAAGLWVEYNLPTCNIGDEKPDTHGNMTVRCSGTWWNHNFGAKNNSMSVQYRYKVDGGTYGLWSNMTVISDGENYTASASLSGLDYKNTYVFQARIIDMLSTTESAEYKTKSLPVFSWGKDDFEFNVPVHFAAGTTGTTEGGNGSEAGFVDGDFTIKGDLRLKKDASNYGCTLRFGDSDYAYITETTDDDITIKASDLNLNGNVKINDNTIEAGTWTPSLNNPDIAYYSSRKGWYLRIGQYVSIGWTIKAKVSNNGYTTTPIQITGAPCVGNYGVAYQSAGGGMCANAYVAGGNTFQCFVMELNGVITTRVQACNNTSNTNLSTSASGCFYPASGEVTLAGSITYMALNDFK